MGDGNYTQFWVSDNGVFSFSSSTSTSGSAGQFTSSYVSTAQPKISGIARDMTTGSDGYVKYELIGSTPNRILVCEFKTTYQYVYNYASTAATVNWQIQLYEANSKIVIVYGEAPTSIPSSYQIGIGKSNNQIWTVNPQSHTAAYSTGAVSSTYSVWPGAYRYYEFDRPVFTCPKPTLHDVANEDIEANSATIRWTPSSEGQTLFDIYYSTASTPAPDEETTPSYSNVSGTLKEIDGLTSSTVYYVWLRGNCGTASDPDISGGWTASKQFQTECGTVASHTWGFEAPNTGGTTSYPLPACWTRPTGTSTTYPYSYSTSYARTGSYALYFSGNTSTTMQIAVLPEIEGGVNGKRLTLYAHNPSTYSASSFSIGYMTDPTDKTTFNEVQSYSLPAPTAYGSTPYTVDFANLDDNIAYIAIKSTTTSYAGIYIDDVTLSDTPNCLEPTITNVTDITSATASLIWTPGNAGQDHWDIYYSTSSTTPTNETTPTIVNTDLNPYPLTGLQHSSTYYVWVRGNCGGEHSGWSNVYSFPTDCEVVTSFPWSETFDDRPANPSTSYSETYKFNDPCWLNEQLESTTSGSGTVTWFQVCSYEQGGNNTNKLQLPDMKKGALTELRLPEMTLPNNNYQFALDMYRVSGATETEGIRVFASTDGEISGATELAFISRNYSTGDGHLIPGESTSGWYTYELPIGFSGTCYIILRGESQYSNASYMDNFVVETIPTCIRPKSPTSTAQTAHTATLSWTNGAEGQDAWQIAYSTSSTFAPTDVFTPGEGETLVDVTTNPATISGLATSTTYYAYVRANCGNSDLSKWSKTKATFTTKSGNAVPTGLSYDNESLTSSEVTVNWTGVATNDLHASFELYISTESITPAAAPEPSDNFITGITASTHHFNTLTAETKL